MLTLTVNVAVMAAALYAVLAYMSWMASTARRSGVGSPRARSGAAEGGRDDARASSIVTAIALFFSTFSTPMLSAALTLGVYVAGYFSADLRNFNQVVESPAAAAAGARPAYYVLPNLSPFDVTAQVVHGLPVGWRYIASSSAYGFTYIAILLVISATIFSRRDFK